MKAVPYLKLERQLMAIENELDSLSAHVHQAGCDCVKPFALARIRLALGAARGSRESLRNALGVRHWTLFAGNSPGQPNATKPWRGKTHGHIYDCASARRTDTEPHA